MKAKSSTSSAFFNLRAFLGFSLLLASVGLGVFAGRDTALRRPDGTTRRAYYRPSPGGNSQGDAVGLARLKEYWHQRLTYPTGRFDPVWVREAAVQHARMPVGVPAGVPALLNPQSPLALSTNGFTALGPQPERMTGCSHCGANNWTTAVGRVNDIAVDPTTTVNGSIVAYLGTAGGGVWKTTNCCSVSTTWSVVTDVNPGCPDCLLISTTAIDSLTIDPTNHNTIYAGTGGESFAFAMGSQGILKSTDAGITWRVLKPLPLPSPPSPSEPSLEEPPPELSAVSKVRVDPNNSNKVVAGTKEGGLFFSYDGGDTWKQCQTNNFDTQNQNVTGLELSNMGGTTRIIAAIGDSVAGANGANGIYKATMGSSGCPDFMSIANDRNGFVFGNQKCGSPYCTRAPMHAGSGDRYPLPSPTTSPSPTASPSPTCSPSCTCGPSPSPIGNQLGRIDIAVAPSNPNYIYAQVQSIAKNDNCFCNNKTACQLGAWASTDGGNTWSYMEGSQGGALRDCADESGDYAQNDYDQGVAVDPNNPERVFFDTYDVWFATRAGNTFFDLTCGFSYDDENTGGPVHVDQHALVFVPGSSSILLLGNDGGVHGTINADIANQTRPTWFNMYTGLNTIQFYSGDISGNFANAASPQANGGAQDNGASSVTFGPSPNGPGMWQEGLCCDGYYARIDPVGTGNSLRFWQGNNADTGALFRCISDCTAPNPPTPSATPTGTPTPDKWGNNVAGGGGNWGGDTQSAALPFDLFHGGIPGGEDCALPGIPGGCGHLIAGTTRVWETIKGGYMDFSSSDWYITNRRIDANMTKGKSYISQVKYSPKYQSVAMVGTNDGNVWIGFDLGTGTQAQADWRDVTDRNRVLPNRSVLGIALDPSVSTANRPRGYVAIGGFDANTPTTPGHVFEVTCNNVFAQPCFAFSWMNKTGNLPDIPANSIIANPNIPQQVFVGTVWGVYFTDDITVANPIWKRFRTGIPHVTVMDMQIDRGATTLSVWTYGRGAYVYPLPGTASLTPTPTPILRPTPTPRPQTMPKNQYEISVRPSSSCAPDSYSGS